MNSFNTSDLLAVRIEIPDERGDWDEHIANLDFTAPDDYSLVLHGNNLSKCEQDFPRKDIIAANYIANDKYLNGTIWIDDPFQVSPPEILDGIIYTMSIVDIAEKPKPVYTVTNAWNPDRGWLRTVYEHVLSNITNPVEYSSKFTGFGNTTEMVRQESPNGYVDFYLDVRKQILPKNYLVVFNVVEFSNKCFLIDTIDQTLSAENVVNVSSTPKIELRAGEENKIVELTLKSSLDLENVSIQAENSSGISIGFMNNSVTFDSSGTAFPLSIIKVDSKTEPHEYSIPFFVNLSLPETIVYPVLFKNIDASRDLATSIQLVNHIKLNVLKEYNPVEVVNNIFQGYAGILSFTGILLASIIGVLAIYFQRHRKR